MMKVLEDGHPSTAAIWTWDKTFKPGKFLSSFAKDQRNLAEGVIASLSISIKQLQQNALMK